MVGGFVASLMAGGRAGPCTHLGGGRWLAGSWLDCRREPERADREPPVRGLMAGGWAGPCTHLGGGGWLARSWLA